MLLRILLLFFAVFGFALQAAGAAPAPQPVSHEAMTRAAIETYIIPRVDAFRAAATPLPDAVAAVCKTGSPESRSELQDRFAKVVTAWAGVDFLRFGPLLENGRREQISFWPDPRGFVGRQLRLLLLSKNDAIAQPGMMAKQSAAVQGLPALESLLYDKDTPLGPGDAAHYRCVVAQAIAQNIVRLAGEVADGWEKPDGWAHKMLTPGPQNDTYKNASEPAVEVVKALVIGLSLTADLQVKPYVDPKIRLVPPYEKSGLQRAFYETSIISLHRLYDAVQLESWLKPDMAWMKDWVSGTWRTLESSDGAGGRAPGAKRQDAPTAREVFDRTNGLRNMVANRFAAAAKLTVGFNELDGD